MRRLTMYRFMTVRDYELKLIQLKRRIRNLKHQKADAQTIVNCEALRLSYMIEYKDFRREH